MAIKIVTLTGRGGSGKTTIMNKLLQNKGPLKLVSVISTTTRKPRRGDIEYEYVTKDVFDKQNSEGQFLWAVEYDGYQYGTKKEHIDKLFLSDKIGILILVPEAVYLLRKYLLSTRGDESSILSFFIGVSSEEVLLDRLRKRGESKDSIYRRLHSSKDWFARCCAMHIMDEYIVNFSERVRGRKATLAIMRFIKQRCGQ